MLAQFAQQFHPVHPRHLDVEHGQIGRIFEQRLQSRFAIGIQPRRETFGLQRDGHGGEDVAVIIDQRNDLLSFVGIGMRPAGIVPDGLRF